MGYVGAASLGINGADLLGDDPAATCRCDNSMVRRLSSGYFEWQFAGIARLGLCGCNIFGHAYVYPLEYVSPHATRVLGAVFCYTVSIHLILCSGFHWPVTGQPSLLAIFADFDVALALVICLDA